MSDNKSLEIWEMKNLKFEGTLDDIINLKKKIDELIKSNQIIDYKNKEYVYFIKLFKPKLDLVKIGKSNNIEKRMLELQRVFGSDYVRLLGVTDLFTESYIQLKFWKYRNPIEESSETFILSDEIKEFIKRLPIIERSMQQAPLEIWSYVYNNKLDSIQYANILYQNNEKR